MSDFDGVQHCNSMENPSKRMMLTSPSHSPVTGSRGGVHSWSGGCRTLDRRLNSHSAVCMGKRNHEKDMMGKLVERRNEKKQLSRMSKEDAKRIARNIYVDTLAREWLNTQEATLEIRAYLVDSVLPTLILGVEKLLNEADQKGLAEKNEMYPNFNPVNFLAQYVMRNNPRYSNFSEASPYVRGLRRVSEELRDQLFDIEDNRLARIKAEAKRRREEREKEEQINLLKQKRRTKAFSDQFAVWNTFGNDNVELALLQNALRTFEEITENFPKEIQEVARFSHALEATDETGKILMVDKFAQYLSKFVTGMPCDIFDQFMFHMSKCASAHCIAAAGENRRIVLSNLFMTCDHSGIGLLYRHRILSLFKTFFDSLTEEIKTSLRNPRKWPVVEVNEADDSLSDEEEIVPSAKTKQQHEKDDAKDSKKTEEQIKSSEESFEEDTT